MRVLVTGSTGNVGREVVSSLLERGIDVLAGDREPDRARAIFASHPRASSLTAVELDFQRPSTFSALDNGVNGVFLLRPPAISDVERTLIPFIDAARRRDVSHIVFLSVAGAAKNRLVPHHKVERHLMEGRGTSWTLLRPGFFAQNFGDAYRRDISADDRIYVPAGKGRVAFVDVRDLADVTATIFESPSLHREAAYTLTGAEAVDFATAARQLSAELGRPIRYEAASLLGYSVHLVRRGLPLAQVAVQLVLHAGLRFGQAARVDPTLERLLHRRPRGLEQYFVDHRALWGSTKNST